jgi:hypothetical protein
MTDEKEPQATPPPPDEGPFFDWDESDSPNPRGFSEPHESEDE